MDQLQQTKNIRILAFMVSGSGEKFKDIIPEKGSRWNPGSVYVVNIY